MLLRRVLRLWLGCRARRWCGVHLWRRRVESLRLWRGVHLRRGRMESLRLRLRRRVHLWRWRRWVEGLRLWLRSGVHLRGRSVNNLRHGMHLWRRCEMYLGAAAAICCCGVTAAVGCWASTGAATWGSAKPALWVASGVAAPAVAG